MTLWDIYQHAQIRGLRASQGSGELSAWLRDQRQDRRADDLEEQVRRLGTLVEALWTVCREQLGVTDEQLSAAVEAIVESERAVAAAGPAKCTSCDAALAADLAHCQFCGAAAPRPPSPFAGV